MIEADFFKIPLDLDPFRKLLKGIHGYKKGLLYIITYYLSSINNPFRLSSKYLKKNFAPLQVSAEKSSLNVHLTIADFLNEACLEYKKIEEPKNPLFPSSHMPVTNKVFSVTVPAVQSYFFFPRRYLKKDFEKLYCMNKIIQSDRVLAIPQEKLFLLVYLWRLRMITASGESNKTFFISMPLEVIRKEAYTIRKRLDFKPREILSSMDKMDHLIRIEKISGEECIIELHH